MFQFKEHNEQLFENKGYFAIGIYNPKYYCNVGTLWRTAAIFGANFIFTVGEGRYKAEKADVTKAHQNIPLFSFDNIQQLKSILHQNCDLIIVELVEKAVPLSEFNHPERAVYLLGSEDQGLPPHIIAEASSNKRIKLPGKISLNVATAGSIVLYDRITKGEKFI